MKLNFQKLDIEIPVEIPVNFMISTGTGIPANRLILTGTEILPGSRSILDCSETFPIIPIVIPKNFEGHTKINDTVFIYGIRI